MTRFLMTLALGILAAAGTVALSYTEIQHKTRSEIYEKATKENHGLYVLDSKTGKIEFKWHRIIIEDDTIKFTLTELINNPGQAHAVKVGGE